MACLSVTQLEAKQGNLGAASGSRQLRQPFLTLKVKVAGAALMGFPWRRTVGWEVEGDEFRQWLYMFSCDSRRGGEHKPLGKIQ